MLFFILGDKINNKVDKLNDFPEINNNYFLDPEIKSETMCYEQNMIKT